MSFLHYAYEMNIKNLHKQQDWDSYYQNHAPLQVKLRSGIFTSYDIFICDTILNKFLPKYHGPIKKQPILCEIGSGDGKLLKKVAKMINYKPEGIEYSREAARIAEKNGVKTIIGDAFDPKLVNKYKDYFDAVFSYGFIEHILPPEKAVKLHLDLIKPGGYFVIQIPRFRGFNYLRIKIFRPDLIKNHNLNIMNEDIIEKLCKINGVKKIYCGNYGTFKLRLPMDRRGFKYYLLKTICYLDYVINPILRLLFSDKGFESYFFSPSTMFIGQKIGKISR